MSVNTPAHSASVSSVYLGLVIELPLRPIRSEAELDRAISMIDRLTDLGELSTDESDYRSVLADLVASYESGNEPEPEITPAEMLRFLIESKGVAQARVAADTGIAESTISEILAGKRKISQAVMRKLADYFRVEPAVFV